MDLSTENAAKLRKMVRPFADKARRVSPEKGGKAKKNVAPQRDGETAKIRTWAQKNGYTVSAHGRIHQHIRDTYYTAQKASSGQE